LTAHSATSPELVLSYLDSLPTLPAVVVRVLQVTGDDRSAASDVVRLVGSDQSLAAKILSVARSAAYGVREPVTTLERGIPLLGLATIRSIALAAGIFDCFGKRSGGAGRAFDRVEFWKHALAVACAARRLARARPELVSQPEEAFVAGLLHDLGKVALDAIFPKAYDRVALEANHARGDIADSERAILGADHTVAGRRLAERWRLPRELRETIWLHHLAADALPASVANPSLISLVQLADTIAREQRIGYSGNHVFYETSARLGERLGFGPTALAAAIEPLAGEVAEHVTLLGLDHETPQGVYLDALRRANAELSRVNAELEASNRRLAAADRYFKAISHFELHLSDWADPPAVVRAAAKAAAAALQRLPLAAFGVRDNASAVDLCWIDRTADQERQFTRAVPPDLATWLAQVVKSLDSIVTQPPPAVRGLLGTTIGATEASTAWLLPILHQGAVAGGIVYLSDSDERQRLADEAEELRSFLTSLGLALGRANAQAATHRLSEDLAESNRRLQQMQAELLRSRTLSMIAEMAAGAAHELNNPLTVIKGWAQRLISTVEDLETQRVLQTIAAKADECSGIVSELLDFARPRPPQLAPVDLAELLAEVRAEWLARTGLPATRLRLENFRSTEERPNFASPAVLADRQQLKSVLSELVSNAVDAIATNEGTVVLGWQTTIQPDLLEVIVEDNGCGMAPSVFQRAFDPFFSQRLAGRRRGLGLPRAYRIIESHGGRIWLESQPGEGTTVHVLLPKAGPPQPQ